MRSLLIVLALFPALAFGACVDGKTPDCTSPTSGCGPDLDGTLPDASTDGPASDGPLDAPRDAPSDAPSNVDSAPADAGNDAGDAAG